MIKSIVDTICPFKLYKINLYRPIWYTDEVLEEATKRKRLHQIARRSKEPSKHEEAIQSRNVLKTLIKNSKKKYYDRYFLYLFS